MTTIVVFALSFLIASAFIFIKAMELKYDKKNIILKLIGRLDSKCDRLVSDIKFIILQLTQSVRYILFVKIKEVCKGCLKKAEEKMICEYKKRQDAIMGKKDIINKGSVSFFLKKITENRINGEKGKIE